jgi:transposase InsO family protein
MIAFIDDHRGGYGLEPQGGSRPICRVLPIAPSTYHAHAAQRADPAKASPRARRDVMLMAQIRRVHAENFDVYGARKVWRQLGREGVVVARCTVERLMRSMGLEATDRMEREVNATVRDCRYFRVLPVMRERRSIPHGPTESPGDPGRDAGPVTVRRERQHGL